MKKFLTLLVCLSLSCTVFATSNADRTALEFSKSADLDFSHFRDKYEKKEDGKEIFGHDNIYLYLKTTDGTAIGNYILEYKEDGQKLPQDLFNDAVKFFRDKGCEFDTKKVSINGRVYQSDTPFSKKDMIGADMIVTAGIDLIALNLTDKNNSKIGTYYMLYTTDGETLPTKMFTDASAFVTNRDGREKDVKAIKVDTKTYGKTTEFTEAAMAGHSYNAKISEGIVLIDNYEVTEIGRSLGITSVELPITVNCEGYNYMDISVPAYLTHYRDDDVVYRNSTTATAGGCMLSFNDCFHFKEYIQYRGYYDRKVEAVSKTYNGSQDYYGTYDGLDTCYVIDHNTYKLFSFNYRNNTEEYNNRNIRHENEFKNIKLTDLDGYLTHEPKRDEDGNIIYDETGRHYLYDEVYNYNVKINAHKATAIYHIRNSSPSYGTITVNNYWTQFGSYAGDYPADLRPGYRSIKYLALKEEED